MTQNAAGNILRRNAPPGEFPAFINSREASWLRGMGGKGKKTKSGLRSFAPPNVYDDPNTLSGGDTSVADANTVAHNQALASAGSAGNAPPVIPPIDPGNITGAATGALSGLTGSGHDTRTPTGPGSVTNPNDPYGIQKKIAGGASDLIDKEYVAPTLTPEERIAATSAETLQARQGVQAMQGTGQTAYGEAAGVGKRISGQEIDPITGQSFLTGKGVDEYMSPHTANVIGGMQDQAMRTMQKQRGALQAQHQMAGAGIGSRGALENAAMSAEVQRGLGQQVAGALESSYA